MKFEYLLKTLSFCDVGIQTMVQHVLSPYFEEMVQDDNELTRIQCIVDKKRTFFINAYYNKKDDCFDIALGITENFKPYEHIGIAKLRVTKETTKWEA